MSRLRQRMIEDLTILDHALASAASALWGGQERSSQGKKGRLKPGLELSKNNHGGTLIPSRSLNSSQRGRMYKLSCALWGVRVITRRAVETELN